MLIYAVRNPFKQDLVDIGNPRRARNGGCVDGGGTVGLAVGGNGDVFEQAYLLFC